MKNHIIVIGGSGSLGFRICKALTEILPDKHIVVGDYKLERGKQTARKLKNASAAFVNIHEYSSIEKSITCETVCMIVAVKQSEPMIQVICVRHSTPCIDLTTFTEFTNKVIEQVPTISCSSVIMSGFFPGMSGIAVKEGIANFSQVDRVAVSLVQNSQANVGLTGMRDMLNIISKPLKNRAGFVKKHSIKLANKQYYPREIHHDEIAILQEHLEIPKLKFYT